MLFKLSSDGNGFVVLRQFTGLDGDGRYPDQIFDGKDGILYGTTSGGGNNLAGTVFKLNQDGTGYSVLFSFPATNDLLSYPRGPLVEGADGVLYGTIGSLNPATNGHVTVFKLDKHGSGFGVLHTVSTGPDCCYPNSHLMQSSDGVLVVTTDGGADTVWKIRTDGSGYAVLHQFTGFPNDGAEPQGRLVEGREGALYGATSGGGKFGGGIVFLLNRDGSGYTVLWNFVENCGAGSGSVAVPLEGSDGALYGTTQSGGAGGGTVFRLNNDGSNYQVLRQDFFPAA